MWIMAADAEISDLAALEAAVQSAVPAAEAGYLVTFGMQPTAPDTGYGYIAQGAPLDGLPGVFRLNRFIEKPDAKAAARMIEAGGNLWNSGMFMFRAGMLLVRWSGIVPMS